MCGCGLGVRWVVCVCVWTHGSGAVEVGLAVERQGAAAGLPPSSGAGMTAEEAEPLGWKVASQVNREREKARTCEPLAWLRN